MSDFQSNFRISTIHEHIKSKAMWAGAIEQIVIPDLLGMTKDDQLVEINKLHTPALLKAIDEIIVNAVDHRVVSIGTKKPVTKIHVSIIDKVITVYNNGSGIPIVQKDGSYLIELAFSNVLSGTNIDKPKDSIKGGTNGLGAKITNLHSEYFIVETVSNKQKYVQKFSNRLDKIGKPVITKTTEEEHTTITFLPVYKELGYLHIDNQIDDIVNWLRLRMHQVAAYVGQDVEVKFNDQVCKTSSTESLAKLLSNEDESIISTTCKNTITHHQLHLSVIAVSGTKKSTIPNMTIINGVVSTAGNHINYIRKIIKDHITLKISKLTKGSKITARDINIKLVMCGAIPGADWSSQNKDTLQVNNDVLKQYKIPTQFLKQIGDILVGNIVSVQSTTKKKVEHDKYFIAKYAGNTKLKNKCMLLAAEGDSAITLLHTGLTQKCNRNRGKTEFVPSFDWIGIISLQGVIINTAKEITEYGESIIQSNKLRTNKRLNMLADAFGLRYGYKYDTDEELSTLNYSKLIICTDQDLDGIGKICSLVLVWIYTFWPKLIEKGYIGKLMTPVIRVYTSKDKIEFYYENEFDIWLKDNKDMTNKCRIKYYKGLATHDGEEAEDMFTLHNFKKNIYLYTLDDIANSLFNIYFGPDPELRKRELVTPVKFLNYTETLELKETQQIPVGKVQLNIDTKLYKNEAINRQLPHAIDGLNPARRKILTASIMRFSQNAKEVKVFQLAGYVADKMLYHHGDMSLNKTIITMAQSYYGARKYPYLLGIGQFGSRHGTQAGSARYISVKLNPIVNLIFPPEDKWLLPYIFDEGIRAEPEYYVPILPMAILESYKIVTEGWNHKTYSRSLKSVLTFVTDYITTKKLYDIVDDFTKNKLSMEDYYYLLDTYPLPADGNIRVCKGIEYSMGDYVYRADKNMIHIRDLPIGVPTISYIKTILKLKDYIDKIEDHSSINDIDIKVYLKSDTISVINKKYGNEDFDPIEDLLNLRVSLKPNLNYYSCDRGVLEYIDKYIYDILYWAPVRKDLYEKRLVRRKILLEVQILKEENIIRYIVLSNELNLSNIYDEQKIEEVFKIHKFPKINTGLLHSPGYVDNDELSISLVDTKDCTYDYILDLKERELTKVSLEKRKEKLEKLKENQKALNKYFNDVPFVGASLWLDEINELLDKLGVSY